MWHRLFLWLEGSYLPLKQKYQNSSHIFWQLLRQIVPFSYDFLTAGPTLVGFILALWREVPTTPRFLVACQSLLIFLIYLIILLLSRILYFIDTLAQWLPIVDSVLAASYLTLTGWLFYRLHTARPIVFAVVSKLWLRYYQNPKEEQ